MKRIDLTPPFRFLNFDRDIEMSHSFLSAQQEIQIPCHMISNAASVGVHGEKPLFKSRPQKRQLIKKILEFYNENN